MDVPTLVVPDAATLIPHRPPFLFVDEIVALSPDKAVTRKLADPKADFFAGHYPGNPIMPGVLVCECAFQTGAILLAHRTGDTGKLNPGPLPVLTRIKNAQFKRMVRPGEMLDIEVALDEILDNAYFMTGRVSAGGKPVLRVEFACTLAEGIGADTA